MAAASVQERLQRAATQNERLLRTLADTGYAGPAYQQTENYISTLKKSIAIDEQKLKELDARVSKEEADHKRYRDSHTRRFVFRISGRKDKFEEQASKEEREWLEAEADRLAATTALKQLNLNLKTAQQQSSLLLDIVKVHNSTALDLDALYNSIFEGPTPGIPEEDRKEQEVVEAQREFDILSMHLGAEKQAKGILLEAAKFLHNAFVDIQDAKSSSTMDAWGVGGTFTEMAENSALSRCQMHVSQTEMLVSQAQRLQPLIRDIGDMHVAQMNFLSNVVFDNVFSDMAMRDRIKDTMGQLEVAKTNLKYQIQSCDARLQGGQQKVALAKGVLESQRIKLQEVRKQAFEKMAREIVQGAPPAYTKEVAA